MSKKFGKNLDIFFTPQSVALIGASAREGSVGNSLFKNLLHPDFKGRVFPVNPRQPHILAHDVFASVRDIPEPIDLAVIATRAPTVPEVLAECAAAKVKGAIIISAGFREIGPAGLALEKRVLEIAKRANIRIIGPNCFGVMKPQTGLNATFGRTPAPAGTVGFISQSGALCTSILEWGRAQKVGFSAFISVGSMIDVDWGDLIYLLGDDPDTKTILIYMESVGHPRTFLSAAREVAFVKPILILKAGKTARAAQAVQSHTGAMTGNDDVIDAAFRRCGVCRVDDIGTLFNMAEVLAKQPKPAGPNLTIVTNAGGPGVLATDALIRAGGKLTDLSPATLEKLDQTLPAYWSHKNPIDILADAGEARFAAAFEAAAHDPHTDGLLAVFAPQEMTDAGAIATKLAEVKSRIPKPILASWMGGDSVEAAKRALRSAGIPVFPYPDATAKLFHASWQYSYHLKSLYETPGLGENVDEELQAKQAATHLIAAARTAGRTILSEAESKHILAAYNIPVTETRIATGAQQAVQIAGEIGYPVVLKLHSHTITHKAAAGGVLLNVRSPEAVAAGFAAIRQKTLQAGRETDFSGVSVQPMLTGAAFEIMLGSNCDPQFGPYLLFGTGGSLVEMHRDYACGLPPLNQTLARRMIETTRVYGALKSRLEAGTITRLEAIVVNFSRLVIEQPRIKEIDINPLAFAGDGFVALDARVILHPQAVAERDLPQPAIRPYPIHYIEKWQTKTGLSLTIRAIRPEDEPLMIDFHKQLSDTSVYFRYFSVLNLNSRIAHDRLARICFVDYDREMVLVAVQENGMPAQKKIVGVGRLNKLHNTNTGEFALLISDHFQGHGLGTKLLQRLVEIGRDERLEMIYGNILYENLAMRRVAKKVGFVEQFDQEEGVVKAVFSLP